MARKYKKRKKGSFYVCKTCTKDCGSAHYLSQHYREFPVHAPAYLVAKWGKAKALIDTPTRRRLPVRASTSAETSVSFCPNCGCNLRIVNTAMGMVADIKDGA